MFSKLGLRMKERGRVHTTLYPVYLFSLVSLFLMRSRWDIPKRREGKNRKEGKWREKKKDQQNFYVYEPMVYVLLLLLWLRFSSAILCALCALCIWFCFAVQLQCGFRFSSNREECIYFHSAHSKATLSIMLHWREHESVFVHQTKRETKKPRAINA